MGIKEYRIKANELLQQFDEIFTNPSLHTVDLY